MESASGGAPGSYLAHEAKVDPVWIHDDKGPVILNKDYSLANFLQLGAFKKISGPLATYFVPLGKT